MSRYQSPWTILGISQTADERTVKLAYAAKLKEIDVETDPQGFIALRKAFDQARQSAIWRAEQQAEEERRRAAGEDDSDTIDDWEDEDWDDEWEGSAPASAYATGHPSSAETHKQGQSQNKIEGIDIDLVGPVITLAASPYHAPLLAHDMADNNISPSGGIRVKPAIPLDDEANRNADNHPFHMNFIDLRLSEDEHRDDHKTDTDGQTLALPAQPLSQIFPDRTPLYVSFFGFAPGTKQPPASKVSLDAFGDLEGVEQSAEPTASPELANDTAPQWPDDIYGNAGYVSFTRDDWGNADRERIAQLLYDKQYGPAEAGEIDRLTTRLFASPHMEELDYRDWMENWVAALISETLPRSDGLLAVASRTFGWGTDPDKLYHSHAVSQCVSRNRDLETIRQMRDPGNRWHDIYTLLQRPAPDKIAWKDKRKWQEVQNFIDNVRAHRPTVEWNLDPRHVALWDELIDAKRSGSGQQSIETPGLKWYHYLFFAFMVLQLLARCATSIDDRQNLSSSGYEQSSKTAERPPITDYTDKARISGDTATEQKREALAPQFNAAIRDPENMLHFTASKLPPTFDLSRYVKTADLVAMTDGKCDLDCGRRIKRELENVAAGTTQVGDLSVRPTVQPTPEPPPKMINVPLKWSYVANDPKSEPVIKYTDGMKKLGFKRSDINRLSKSLVRKNLPKGKVEWECKKQCDAIIDEVLSRN